MKTREINSLLNVLKKHGVESFKHGDLELKFGPVKLLGHLQEIKNDVNFSEKVTEDDLYYSAKTIKQRTR